MTDTNARIGARWWKFDFHLHTPYSTDYGRGDAAVMGRLPREFLLDCMRLELDCVAITDHNGGGWVDRLKSEYAVMSREQAEGFRPLHIFPGVEITCQNNVHVLAILDPAKGGSDIDTLLGQCGYGSHPKGESSKAVDRSLIDTLNEIVKFGALPIPAHVDDTRAGLFARITDGNTLRSILKHPGICAMETVVADYLPPELYRSESTAWVAVAGSDAHHPDEVGRRYSWIKMGEPSLEGLKLALLDGSLSVRRWDEAGFHPDQSPNWYIEGIEIADARYCGHGKPLRIAFSPWLNCVIGGRGSGKSTIIEMARIGLRRDGQLKTTLGPDSEVTKAFDRFYRIPSDRRDQGALSATTKIRISCRVGGHSFALQWAQDGSLAAIQRFDEAGLWVDSPGDIKTRFPVSIYSQKEIFEMAGKPAALLGMIDEAPDIDCAAWRIEHEKLRAQYKARKAQIRELESRMGEEARLRGELEDTTSKLLIFERGENAQSLKEYHRIRSQARELDAFGESLQECLRNASAMRLEVMSTDAGLFVDTPEDRLIAEVAADTAKQIDALNEGLQELRTKAEAVATRWRSELEGSVWKKRYTMVAEAYEKLVAKLAAAGGLNLGV